MQHRFNENVIFLTFIDYTLSECMRLYKPLQVIIPEIIKDEINNEIGTHWNHHQITSNNWCEHVDFCPSG